MPKEDSIKLIKYSKTFYNYFPVLRVVRLMTLHAKLKMYFQQQFNLCELHANGPLGSSLAFRCKNHQLKCGVSKQSYPSMISCGLLQQVILTCHANGCPTKYKQILTFLFMIIVNMIQCSFFKYHWIVGIDSRHHHIINLSN